MNERRGWLRLKVRKQGPTWLLRHTRIRHRDGKRVETTKTIGLKKVFPTEAAAWREAERRGYGRTEKLNENPTFQELAETYLDERTPKIANSTAQLHKHVVRDYLIPRWGTKRATDIRALQIQRWLDDLGKGKNKLSNPTRAKLRSVMSRVYSFGRLYDLIPHDCNPLEPVKCPSESETEQIAIMPRQAFRLATGLSIMVRTMLFLAAIAGLRVSEVLGLKWMDIDFERQRIFIRRTWVCGKEGKPKTKASARAVPLGLVLGGFLLQWKSETPYAKPGDWVFPSLKLKGKKPPSASQIIKDHVRVRAQELGLITKNETRRFGFHAMRHGLASFLVGQGVDPKTVQGLLRHARASTTLNLYVHEVEDKKMAAQDLVTAAMLETPEVVQ